MSPGEYLEAIDRALRYGNATEHTYRGFLKGLIEARANGEAEATNEPKRVKCGAPDYIVARKKDRLTLGYIEAKDVGIDLNEVEKSEQLKRYLQHLPNLLLTDYLEVRWYVQGERGIEKRGRASLGHIGAGGKVVAHASEQAIALGLIDSFLRHKPLPIHSAQELALRLAHFTHLIRDIIVEAFANGEPSQQLQDWRAAFAGTLLPELAKQPDKEKEHKARAEFADMFAQTLAYGMFSARAAGPGGKFTREQARKLIPRTNPFLRSFFEQITGAALDDEPFAGFVDDLIQTLDHAGMDDILRDFGTRSRRSDPVVHFYETFLQAYDPKLRELRGVYYTPEPVVNYIVESLDLLLKDKTKFNIKEGLADRSKAAITRSEGGKESSEESHRVLILDPATGTATFLYRVMDFIRDQFERKKNVGAWGDYIHEHLLPRLFGFELLMAPYAVAHFKLGLALGAWDKEPLFRQALSYEPRGNERINIFLTNTLEDIEETAQQLGPLRMLSDEANAAYEVKQNKPVLVILGNPPYSGHSANKGEWITSLIRDYMRCDGKPLGERNPKWLHDDYVKFIRWAQWRIDKTGQGILGFITNHGYLDNPTFRGMRQSLMQSFDEIYLLDLHGNSKKKELDPATGAPDKNVFDIQQGVCIGIFVKLPHGSRRRNTKCIVRHAHLYGAQRKTKYEWLDNHSVGDTQWTQLEPVSPNYFFIPQNKTLFAEYEQGWKITDAMPANGWGIATRKDYLLVDFDEKELGRKFERILALPPLEAIAKFGIKTAPHWDFIEARKELPDDPWNSIHRVLFRPFDHRYVFYEKAMIERGDHRFDLMRHMFRENVALITVRRIEDSSAAHFFSTNEISVLHSTSSKEGNFVFPLYLYPNGKLPDGDLFVREEPEEKRRPNFSAAFINDFCERLKAKFVPEGLGKPSKGTVGPELIFNYAYAVFHSPGYRERYAEFLRTDFPRLPLTGDLALFQELAGFGGHLVDLHARGQGDGSGVSFPMKGANVIEEVRYQPPQSDGQDRHAGRVWISDRQYFEGIAEAVWRFPIGGYLPAERWLKDRIGRTLSYDDQEAYPRIVNALGETRRIMDEIEKCIAGHGGWPAAFE